jgi:prophage antirepressor-like protein
MAQICPQSAATHPRKRRKLEDARLRDFFPVPESIGASDAKALENLPVYGSRKEPVFLGSEIAKTVGTDASGPKKMSASWNDERYAYKASCADTQKGSRKLRWVFSLGGLLKYISTARTPTGKAFSDWLYLTLLPHFEKDFIDLTTNHKTLVNMNQNLKHKKAKLTETKAKLEEALLYSGGVLPSLVESNKKLEKALSNLENVKLVASSLQNVDRKQSSFRQYVQNTFSCAKITGAQDCQLFIVKKVAEIVNCSPNNLNQISGR